MRILEEQQFAVECLRLADGDIEKARAMLAFVTDDDTTSAEGFKRLEEGLVAKTAAVT